MSNNLKQKKIVVHPEEFAATSPEKHSTEQAWPFEGREV